VCESSGGALECRLSCCTLAVEHATIGSGVGGGSTDPLFDARSNYTTNSCILESVHRACDECLAHSAAAAALVPAEIAAELRPYHSPLAEGRGQTAGRHVMLGRGRNIQGAPERMEGSRVLLMQFDTDAGLNWMMGDCGALQYWITIDDLRALRFGRFKATLEGH
jgi:hypothetical protein